MEIIIITVTAIVAVAVNMAVFTGFAWWLRDKGAEISGECEYLERFFTDED